MNQNWAQEAKLVSEKLKAFILIKKTFSIVSNTTIHLKEWFHKTGHIGNVSMRDVWQEKQTIKEINYNSLETSRNLFLIWC